MYMYFGYTTVHHLLIATQANPIWGQVKFHVSILICIYLWETVTTSWKKNNPNTQLANCGVYSATHLKYWLNDHSWAVVAHNMQVIARNMPPTNLTR